MLEQNQNLSFNSLEYYLKVITNSGSSYDIDWPSLGGAKEATHSIKLQGFSEEGVNDSGATVGNLTYGADAYGKVVFYHETRSISVVLFPNSPALDDMKALLSACVPSAGSIVKGMVQMQIIRNNWSTYKQDVYPVGIPSSIAGLVGGNKMDGQSNVNITFQMSNKPTTIDLPK